MFRKPNLFAALLSFFAVIGSASQKFLEIPIARSKGPVSLGGKSRGFHAPLVSQNHQVYDDGLFTPFDDLSTLSENEYALLSHPAFPAHSIRIKKAKFCDGGVK